MPFKSARQRRFLFKNKPSVARKFVKDSKRKKRRRKRRK